MDQFTPETRAEKIAGRFRGQLGPNANILADDIAKEIKAALAVETMFPTKKDEGAGTNGFKQHYLTKSQIAKGRELSLAKMLAYREKISPKILGMWSEGLTQNKIAYNLNKQGITTFHGKLWTEENVKYFIRMERKRIGLPKQQLGHRTPVELPFTAPQQKATPARRRKRQMQTVVRQARPIVKKMLDENKTWVQIRDELNRLEIYTMRGGDWTASNLKNLVTRHINKTALPRQRKKPSAPKEKQIGKFRKWLFGA